MKTMILIRVRVPFRNAVLLGTAVLLGAAPGELNSDTQSASVTSSFLEPAKRVSFLGLVTTGDTHLGRAPAGVPAAERHVVFRPAGPGQWVKVGSGPDTSSKMTVYGNVRVGGKLCFNNTCYANFEAGIGCFGDGTPPCAAVPTRVACGSGSLTLPYTLTNAFDKMPQGEIPPTYGLTGVTSVLLSQKRGSNPTDWECKLPPARPNSSATCQGNWYVNTGNPSWRINDPNAWKTSKNWICNPRDVNGNLDERPEYAKPSEYCRDNNTSDAFSLPSQISCNTQPGAQGLRTCVAPIPSCSSFATQNFTWTLNVENIR